MGKHGVSSRRSVGLRAARIAFPASPKPDAASTVEKRAQLSKGHHYHPPPNDLDATAQRSEHAQQDIATRLLRCRAGRLVSRVKITYRQRLPATIPKRDRWPKSSGRSATSDGGGQECEGCRFGLLKKAPPSFSKEAKVHLIRKQ
jgi:hypothetical protein